MSLSLRFDPLIHLGILIPAVILALALTLWFYARHRQVLARRTWCWLLAMKLTGLAILVLGLLNPYTVRRRADTENLRLAVLLDVTGSMATTDTAGDRSRLDVLNRDILAADAPFQRRVLSQYPNRASYVFAGDAVRRLDVRDPLEPLPGGTDIDGAMAHVLPRGATPDTLGALLLVTDGGDNLGAALIEGAEPYRRARIPVHIIGVGDPRARPDLAILFHEPPRKATRGKPYTLSARLSRNAAAPSQARVELYDGTRLVDSRDIDWQPDELERDISFERTAFTAGFKTYKIHVIPMPGEENVINNTDFTGFDVADPEDFRVLYCSGTLDWNLSFLTRLAEDQPRLQVDAVVRLGQEAWLVRGITRAADAPPLRGLPDIQELNHYDCLIVQLSFVAGLSPDDLKRLAEFIEYRGGGVVFLGIGPDSPNAEALQRLLPLTSIPRDILVTHEEPLTFKPSRVLAGDRPELLDDMQAKLRVSPDSPAYHIDSETGAKPGAMRVLEADESGWIALAAQQYGAGKTAYLNLSDTWKWVMASDSGNYYYGMFWTRLIMWLASSSKERAVLKPAGRKLDVGQETRLTLDLLDERYQPALNARIDCLIITPDGDEETLTFWPEASVDGRYAASFIPRDIGDYRLSLAAQIGAEDPLRLLADYVVADRSLEAQPRPLDEMKLRGLARLTDGQYWHYSDLDQIEKLPFSQDVNQIETRSAWLDSSIFALALLLLLLPDWIARRRAGLR